MNHSQLTDTQLFQLLQTASREAFAFLYQRHFDGVYLCISRLSRDPDLARDLTQDVFKSLWDHRMQLKDASHLRRYIYFLAKAHFLSFLRAKRANERLLAGLAASLPASESSTELIISMEDAFGELEAWLEELSPQRKRVLQLRYFEGLDVRSIASRLQIAPQTVRNHLSQTLEFLHEKKILTSAS